MRQQVEETARDAILVEDAALIRMMGMPVLEALPSRAVQQMMCCRRLGL